MLSRRTYIEGQTTVTAKILNDIQDSVINLEDSVIDLLNFNRDVVTNTGVVSAVKGQENNICSITLTPPQ